jgi:hypothetical protein
MSLLTNENGFLLGIVMSQMYIENNVIHVGPIKNGSIDARGIKGPNFMHMFQNKPGYAVTSDHSVTLTEDNPFAKVIRGNLVSKTLHGASRTFIEEFVKGYFGNSYVNSEQNCVANTSGLLWALAFLEVSCREEDNGRILVIEDTEALKNILS